MRVGQTAFPKGGCDSPYHLTCFSYHVTLTLLLSTDQKKCKSRDFPGGLVVKNLPSHAGEAGLIPGWGTRIPQVSQHGYIYIYIYIYTHTRTWPNIYMCECVCVCVCCFGKDSMDFTDCQRVHDQTFEDIT